MSKDNEDSFYDLLLPDDDAPDDNYREEAFERELRRTDQAAEDARYFAAHPEPKEAPPLRPEPEYIAGIPFYPTDLGDVAECGICRERCDVGGEIKAHIAAHDAEKLEAFSERR